MSGPTKAQLEEELQDARAAKDRTLGTLKAIDPEARAYSACFAALSNLTTTGSMRATGSRPDRDAIRRVIDTLKARFDIEEPDRQEPDHTYFEPEFHVTEDARDTVISQLIDALRKS